VEQNLTNALRNGLDALGSSRVLRQLLLERVLNTNNALNTITKVVAELVELGDVGAIKLRDQMKLVTSLDVLTTLLTLSFGTIDVIGRNRRDERLRWIREVEVADALGSGS
jgi:hypothetical protein